MKRSAKSKQKAPRKQLLTVGTNPELEQDLPKLQRECPLLFDRKRFWRWACKRYGKTFMIWVRDNWGTATEREIQVMHRAWIAAGGAAS